MQRLLAIASVLAMLTTGCIGALTDDSDDLGAQSVFDDGTITRVQERHNLDFVTDDKWSHTLTEGLYGIAEPLSIHVPVDLPPTEGLSQAAGTLQVHYGVFLPEIPGCDWTSDALPDECRVPVVADAGPYYSGTGGPAPQTEGDSPATEKANRLGGFLIEELVPHGYAVAQISVTGTGDSGGCQDLMGQTEQAGIDAAVTSLGEAAWSNGNVGLIGRSYDGSTPWEAATFGNPHLKTIVPISGLIGVHELMWRNGTSELRGGTGLLWGLYAAMMVDGEADDAEAACKDVAAGLPMNAAAYVTGDHVAPEANDYWEERYFLDRALENYDGSVYFIHGLQDWNVDPHMAFPTYNTLVDAGYDVKGLFGQWDHAYPDRVSDHEDLGSGRGGEAFPATVRYDWAQDLLEWFDHYLKGTGAAPQLHVEVQDNTGRWRIEETYPPRDRTAVELTLDQTTRLHDTPDVVAGADAPGDVAGNPLGYEFPPLSATEDTILAGTHHLHVGVTPTGPGGQLFAELRDAETGLRLGHATMDLRYAAGGTEMQPVAPGVPLTAMMEFQAFDAVLPAGHGLVLVLTPTGEDYLPGPVLNPVEVHVDEGSVLRVFTVDPAPDDFFVPPGHEDLLGSDGSGA